MGFESSAILPMKAPEDGKVERNRRKFYQIPVLQDFEIYHQRVSDTYTFPQRPQELHKDEFKNDNYKSYLN